MKCYRLPFHKKVKAKEWIPHGEYCLLARGMAMENKSEEIIYFPYLFKEKIRIEHEERIGCDSCSYI